jgi:hypothetical protein
VGKHEYHTQPIYNIQDLIHGTWNMKLTFKEKCLRSRDAHNIWVGTPFTIDAKFVRNLFQINLIDTLIVVC